MFALLKNVWPKIDGYLLAVCKNITERYFERIGKTNFFLCRVFCYLIILLGFYALIVLNQYTLYFKTWFVSIYAIPIVGFMGLGYRNSLPAIGAEIDIINMLINEKPETKKHLSRYRKTSFSGLFVIFCFVIVMPLLARKIDPTYYFPLILKYSCFLFAIYLFDFMACYFYSCKNNLPVKKISLVVGV